MPNHTSLWLVTGACSGIGAAVIKAVTASGAQAIALDINDAAGQQLAETTGAIYQHCDVSQPEDWAQVMAKLDGIGAPTHVHLNAGIQIAPPNVPLEEYQFDAMRLDRYRKMMGVNVDGVVFGLHALLPKLQAGAAIVVTGSVAGVVPYDIDPLYAMSKHAVTGLVRSLGPTLAKRDIKINALCPAGIDTAIIPDAQRNAKVPLMTPELIAEEVIALMAKPETGKTWVKSREDKPLYISRAMNDKG